MPILATISDHTTDGTKLWLLPQSLYNQLTQTTDCPDKSHPEGGAADFAIFFFENRRIIMKETELTHEEIQPYRVVGIKDIPPDATPEEVRRIQKYNRRLLEPEPPAD